jgi:hypothetical protein
MSHAEEEKPQEAGDGPLRFEDIKVHKRRVLSVDSDDTTGTNTPIEVVDLDELHNEVFGKPKTIHAVHLEIEEFEGDRKRPGLFSIKGLLAGSRSDDTTALNAAKEFMEQRKRKSTQIQ